MDAEIFSDPQNCPYKDEQWKLRFENAKNVIFPQKKSQNIKKTLPFIKNLSGYIFYNFDKILRKKYFCRFGPKMAPIKPFFTEIRKKRG